MMKPYNRRVARKLVTVVQNEDNGGRPNELGQELTIETGDAGGGPYLVITTTRWALDDDEIGDFCSYLKKFIAEAKEEWYDLPQ